MFDFCIMNCSGAEFRKVAVGPEEKKKTLKTVHICICNLAFFPTVSFHIMPVLLLMHATYCSSECETVYSLK